MHRARRGRRDVVTGWAERADPAGIEQRLDAIDHLERLGAVVGNLQQHAADEENEMRGDRRDVRELQGLLELRACAGSVAQMQECLAQAHPRERLAGDCTQLAAERAASSRCARAASRFAREQLGLAEHGGGERLAAAGSRLLCLRAQPLGKGGEALVGIACREHVLGHAQVGVEDATGKPGRVPDLRELAARGLLPATLDVGEHAVEEGHVTRIGRNGVRLRSHPTRALPVARVPRHHASLEDRLAEVLGPLGLELLERGLAPAMSPAAMQRARAADTQRGHLLRGGDLDCLGVRGRSIGIAGTVEQLRAQREQARTLVCGACSSASSAHAAPSRYAPTSKAHAAASARSGTASVARPAPSR